MQNNSPTDFKELLCLWPSINRLALDLGECRGTVWKWKNRNRIPAQKWKALLKSAQDFDVDIDANTLIDIASRGEH